MYGYFQLYFKLISKDKITYIAWESDFTKDITKEFYNFVSDSIKKGYDEIYKDNFEIYECTKEEYESFNSKKATIFKWEGDNEKIEQITK